ARGGRARGHRFEHRQAKAFELARVEEGPSAGVEVAQLFARNPTGEGDAIAERKLIAQGGELRGEESMDAGDHKPKLGTPLAELRERAQQAIEILVRVQRAHSEQKLLGRAACLELE